MIAGLISGACNAGLLATLGSMMRNKSSISAGSLELFFALILFLLVTRFISETLLARLGQSSLKSLRLNLSRSVLAVSLRSLEKMGTHRILTVLTEDIPAITAGLLAVPTLCINASVIVCSFVYLLVIDWKKFALLLVVIIVGSGSYQLFLNRGAKYIRRAHADGALLQKHFQSLTAGIKELKLSRKRSLQFLDRSLYPAADACCRNHTDGLLFYTVAATWGQALIFAILGSLMAALSYHRLEQPIATTFIIILLYLMTPLQVIMNFMPVLGRASVAIETVQQLGLELSPELEQQSGATVEEIPWEVLALRGIVHSYRYEDDTAGNVFTLGPLDVTIPAGELVFVTGGNGSGKTTLAKVLTGLYLPERGNIHLGSRLITAENISDYRQQFAAVWSDGHVFEVLPECEHPHREMTVADYLCELKLSHKVSVADGKLSTTRLSQGQRKRLALLAAFLEDRPIYLFDEFAADQDPEFREIFYLRILHQLKARGKTVIVISHDERYFYLADRFVRLELGQIVETRIAGRNGRGEPDDYVTAELR